MQNASNNSTSPRKKIKLDFRVDNHGSILLIVPLSASGREWLKENIGADNGYQPYFPTVIVEPRFLDDIITGIQRDGLVVR
jgi:hypothetical protein